MTRNRSKTDRSHIVWEKTGGVCAHCGRHASSRKQTIDHYIPRSCGGGFDLRNLMPLCKKCNVERGNRLIDPTVFYSYASPEVIQKCIEYQQSFLDSHTSMSGDIY